MGPQPRPRLLAAYVYLMRASLRLGQAENGPGPAFGYACMTPNSLHRRYTLRTNVLKLCYRFLDRHSVRERFTKR